MTAGVSLFAGLASAAALTGAAFFTVSQASCGEGGSYVRHDSHVEFVGGCVDSGDLPPAKTQRPARDASGEHSYQK